MKRRVIAPPIRSSATLEHNGAVVVISVETSGKNAKDAHRDFMSGIGRSIMPPNDYDYPRVPRQVLEGLGRKD